MIDILTLDAKPYDYALSKKGKSILLECKDEKGELAGLSFLSRIDLKEILNYCEKIQIKFPIRAIEIKRTVENQEAHKLKAEELGYTHLVFNQAVKGYSHCVCGLRVTDLPEEGFQIPGEHRFYVYRSEAQKRIENEKELTLLDLYKKELEGLEKSDKEVWFELPDQLSIKAIKALDIRAKKTKLIIRGAGVEKLKKESKISTSLLVLHEIKNALWPVFQTGLQESLDDMKGHNYGGLFITVDRLPKGEGILDLNLWTIAQAQIRGSSIKSLQKAWLSKKEMNEPFEEATLLANLFNGSIPASKTLFNKILCDIQLLEDKTKSEQFRAFFRDVRRLLHKSLQDNQINIPYVLREEDFLPSYYTHAVSHGGSSIMTQAEVSVKKNIDLRDLDDSLREIYFQNTL